MTLPTLTELTQAVTDAVAQNDGTPIAVVPTHNRPDLCIGTVVWRRHADQRPITHTFVFNNDTRTAFLEHGDYHLAPYLGDFYATRLAAIRAFPDLPQHESPLPPSVDARDMLPHVLATQLMVDDPATHKKGYTKENAILATIDFLELDEDAALVLRHNMGEAVLSVYSVSRRFGGADEGGWWYDDHDHIVTLTEPTLFWQLAAVLAELPQKDVKRFRTNGGPDHRLLIEDSPRALQTTETPRYE